MTASAMNGSAQPQKGCSEHAFHVDHDAVLDRWDVVDLEGRILGHRQDREEAVELAIREAHHIQGRGDDVVVCVEQKGGHYALAWSSPR